MKKPQELDITTAINPRAVDFERALRERVVGQDDALNAMVEIYETILAGLHPPNRPMATMLFLGPTGTGKTRMVEAAAETLFGSPNAMLKINCAEFIHGHEIAKLIGSPPGYLGHLETPPFLTQERLNQNRTEKDNFTLVLFDEIEKANDTLWNLLLGILDKGELTLGNNRTVDFSRCIIVMTSNAGAKEMGSLTDGGMGFGATLHRIDNRHDQRVGKTAIDAVKKKFSPEFCNRLDKMIVFKTLRAEHLDTILEIELGKIQQRILQATNNQQFVFTCDKNAKAVLLQEGVDAHYGARELKRVIERRLVLPLARLVSSNRVKLGDFVEVSLKEGAETFTFTKTAENALVPVLMKKHAHGAGGD